MSDEKRTEGEERGKLLREARELTKKLGGFLSERLDANEISPEAKIPYKARVLREALLHRTWDLADSACEHFERDSQIVALVLARAAFETAALVFMLHKKVKEVIDRNTLGDFDEGFLMRTLFGRKDDQESPYQATNVLTCIEHLDRYISNASESPKGAILKHFAGLCEHAHPNWEGTLGYYCEDVDGGHSEFGRGRGGTPIEYGIQSLCVSVSIAGSFHHKLTELEQPFRVLCERELP